MRAHILAVQVGLGAAASAAAQGLHREGFDGPEPLWSRGPANVSFTEESHMLTAQFSHSLPNSEYIRIKAELAGQVNPFVYYAYPTPNAPIGEDLTLSVWVRASRPGVQLAARVVLPRERNPDNLNEPMTTLLRGESYSVGGGFWQPLELRRPVKLLKDEQQRLRAELKRDVNIDGAYIDRVLLNVCAGSGLTEVWVDDVTIGPVVEPKPPQSAGGSGSNVARSGAGTPSAAPAAGLRGGSLAIEFNREQLRVGGRSVLFRAIRHTDTPLRALREAGLNTLVVDGPLDAALAEDANREGFWIVPTLTIDPNDPEATGRQAAQLTFEDHVLFWYLGSDRRALDADAVNRAAQAVRSADPQRAIAADAWDGMWTYSRQIDLLSAHRFPLMTSLELPQYRDWLEQRRRLARPGTFFWTWVQTHLQDWFIGTVLPELAGTARSEEPIGPQAEQIRMLTYLALTAGCRGVGFWSDRFLTDNLQGRDRLLALALLNQELAMLEPVILTSLAEPLWIDTSVKEVKAAVIRCDRGLLVLPLWLGKGAQFVPGQAAVPRLTMVVPQAPAGSEPWIVSPAEVRTVSTPRRVVGGTEITLTEFDTSAVVVFTSDKKLVEFWQTKSRSLVKLAAQYAYQLAAIEIEKAEKVQDQLASLAPAIPDAKPLLDDARRRHKDAAAAWSREDFRTAYRESLRAVRPIRILMRAQWESAAKSLGPDAPPTASPYAVSFFTLPRHWKFRAELERCLPGGNAVPDGDFERSEQLGEGWQLRQGTPENLEAEARVDAFEPRDGQRCLKLEIRERARAASGTPPTAIEPAYVGVTTPPVAFPPGTLVRVSGWMKITKPILASPDGALLFDSAGGEPLGVRLTQPTPWKYFVLYRRTPANGQVQLTAALTGIGTVYFDDLKIEPLTPR